MYSKEIKLDPVSRFLSGKFSKLLIVAAIAVVAYFTA